MANGRTIPVLALILAGILLSSCGGGGGSSPTAPGGANVSGTWDASITPNLGPAFGAVFTLSQAGTHVTGTFTTTQSLGGTVSGTVTASLWSFTIRENPPCSGTFAGSATVTNSGRRMTGSFQGTNVCSGTTSNAFTATKR